MSLLGDDFIENCKYMHEPHSDIVITKLDFDSYCNINDYYMNSDELLDFIDDIAEQ